MQEEQEGHSHKTLQQTKSPDLCHSSILSSAACVLYMSQKCQWRLLQRLGWCISKMVHTCRDIELKMTHVSNMWKQRKKRQMSLACHQIQGICKIGDLLQKQ